MNRCDPDPANHVATAAGVERRCRGAADGRRNGRAGRRRPLERLVCLGDRTVAAGETWVVPTTLCLRSLTAISTGGDIVFGDSDRRKVAELNRSLDLRLTAGELAALPVQNTVVRSNRFGIMWHGGGQPDIDGGSVTIDGGTVINTAKTMFVDKGHKVNVTADGSEGARLRAGNGVIWQLMESDDPGPVVIDGQLVNQGVYHEPTDPPVKDPLFDVTAVHDQDAVVNLTNIGVQGDFYNGLRKTKNLVLNLDRLVGVRRRLLLDDPPRHRHDHCRRLQADQRGDQHRRPDGQQRGPRRPQGRLDVDGHRHVAPEPADHLGGLLGASGLRKAPGHDRRRRADADRPRDDLPGCDHDHQQLLTVNSTKSRGSRGIPRDPRDFVEWLV